MIACITAATLLGVEGRPVHVEVHVSGGLPGFTVVGLCLAASLAAADRWPADAPAVVQGIPGAPDADRETLVRKIAQSQRIVERAEYWAHLCVAERHAEVADGV